MSAHMTNINNDTNNTNSQDRRTRSPRGSSNPEAQCLLNGVNHQFLLKSPNVQRQSCESASPRSGGDEGLILRSDRVSAAHSGGGISQTRQVTSSLTGIAQNHGQTLVSAIVVNPHACTSWCCRQCLLLDSASKVHRVRRLATSHEPQWNVRQRRDGSKGGIHGALLSGDRRQRLAHPVQRDNHADQLCRLFKQWRTARRQAHCLHGLGRTRSRDPGHSTNQLHRHQGLDCFSADPTTRTVCGTSQTMPKRS